MKKWAKEELDCDVQVDHLGPLQPAFLHLISRLKSPSKIQRIRSNHKLDSSDRRKSKVDSSSSSVVVEHLKVDLRHGQVEEEILNRKLKESRLLTKLLDSASSASYTLRSDNDLAVDLQPAVKAIILPTSNIHQEKSLDEKKLRYNTYLTVFACLFNVYQK